ncbi:hypothetical protein TSUD_150570 [Trifolium subterraneum]|uniref:Uncharacterized protein n=1 Tax=Trifolium subterraneum TaxID=3900 RepID=A0A2Z6M2K8_TRISU|nr:hypothetical protein TSUD_150570 [Trifolium subterraneum]
MCRVVISISRSLEDYSQVRLYQNLVTMLGLISYPPIGIALTGAYSRKLIVVDARFAILLHVPEAVIWGDLDHRWLQ